MAKIGSFGVEAEHEENTFDWLGQEMRVNPELGELTYVDFFEEFGDLDENDPRAITAIKSLLRQVVHADDFDAFWALGKARRQGVASLMDVAQKIVEAISGVPTGRSSDSSTGPSGTAPSSTAVSYSQTRQELEQSGRPELALVYLEAQEAGVAS